MTHVDGVTTARNGRGASAAPGAWQQLRFLAYELRLLVNTRPWRWLTIWLGGAACVIVSYRLDRALYLALGRWYVLLRPLFFPLFLLLRVLSAPHDISYRADIGRGLKVLHPTLGVVVSAHAVCGESLVLTGGNCIGGRGAMRPGDVRLGDDVTLGANAVVLGPAAVGDRCVVGAGAVVVHDAPPDAVLVGVPARAVGSAGVRHAGDPDVPLPL